MISLFPFLTSTSNSEQTNEQSSSERLSEMLRALVKNPIFYIVVGALFLLVIVFYLLKRIVKAKPNSKIIVVRKGKIHKVIDETTPRYFLTPFVDSIGSTISLGDRTITSDKMFINNGPDFLYQVNFTLSYRVINAEEFYEECCKASDDYEQKMITMINDHFREYADKGNALMLAKDYRIHTKEILDLFNEAISSLSVEAVSFKINFIQPLGK